jgi:3-isopropylmalate/(R)-2-methylmalate dehydratase large subunit
VADHNVPTTDRSHGIEDPISRLQVETLDANTKEYGVTYFNMNDKRQGIVHVIGPEQGATLPGMTVVCGDSHTSTHGAFGCLAHGIGTSEVEHVLATQTLLAKKSKAMLVQVDGALPAGVTAKDIVLAVIGKIGTAGGTGYAIEFGGSTIRALSMEGRMTVCNMAIEAGARAGMVAVDDTTIDYVKGRPFSPAGPHWEHAVSYWRTLHSDPGAKFDLVVTLNAAEIRPQVTWGTSPEHGYRSTAACRIRTRKKTRSSATRWKRRWSTWPHAEHRDLGHPHRQGLHRLLHQLAHRRPARRRRRRARPPARLEREAGDGGAGFRPGEGTGRARRPRRHLPAAGFEWREPGCSMCLAMNADRLDPGERCASTSNRNFEGRQGRAGAPTWYRRPWRRPPAFVAGHFVDVRALR